MTRLAAGLWLLLQGPALLELTGRVVDDAGVLTAEQEQQLGRRLEALERDSSVQLVVVTLDTLEGVPIEDYTHRLAQAWGIGQAETDNGIVLLVAVRDRRVRIEVGYGLEGAIPDGLAGRIIRERMTPAFREGDYFAGLTDAVTGLELASRREYPDAPRQTPDGWSEGVSTWLMISVFILGMLGSLFGVVVAMIAGAVLVPLLSGWGWWGVPLGAVAGLLASRLFRSRRGGGWSYPSSGGGFRGGGGGFSGGGGSFGGGGASGSW